MEYYDEKMVYIGEYNELKQRSQELEEMQYGVGIERDRLVKPEYLAGSQITIPYNEYLNQQKRTSLLKKEHAKLKEFKSNREFTFSVEVHGSVEKIDIKYDVQNIADNYYIKTHDFNGSYEEDLYKKFPGEEVVINKIRTMIQQALYQERIIVDNQIHSLKKRIPEAISDIRRDCKFKLEKKDEELKEKDIQIRELNKQLKSGSLFNKRKKNNGDHSGNMSVIDNDGQLKTCSECGSLYNGND